MVKTIEGKPIMSTAATSRWKSFEKRIEKLLLKYKIPAKRKTRGSNFAESTWDVDVLDHPEAKIDGKYSQAGFKINRLLAEAEAKYCKEKGDYALVFTNDGYKEQGARVTMDDDFFGMIYSYWLGCATKEQLLEIYNK